MRNQALLRGLVLIAIALGFGIPASTYPVGGFSHAGPGLFPLLVSSIIGVIGLVMIVQSRLEQGVTMTFNVRNIVIVLASLVGFVVVAEYLKVIAAIFYLVFVSTLAGSNYSIGRNLKICVVLIAIAFAFRTFLGLQLPLF